MALKVCVLHTLYQDPTGLLGPGDDSMYPHLGTFRVLCYSCKVPSRALAIIFQGHLTKLLLSYGSTGHDKAMCHGMSYLSAREIKGPWPLFPLLQRQRSPWVPTPLSGAFRFCSPYQRVKPARSSCLWLRAPWPACTPPPPSIHYLCLLLTFTRPRQQGHPQATSLRLSSAQHLLLCLPQLAGDHSPF